MRTPQRPRQIGVYEQADGSILVVYDDDRNRDGIASQTIRAGAVKQLVNEGRLVGSEQPEVLATEPDLVNKDNAREAILKIVTAVPGVKFGTLITFVADELHLDETDVEVRSEIASIANRMARRGDVNRDDDDKWSPV